MAAAEDRDELRVAGGVYRPDLVEGAPTNPQSPDTIWLEQQGLTISGGYAGLGAINPDERDIEAYETVITGDVNGDDTENWENRNDNLGTLISYRARASGSRGPLSDAEVDAIARAPQLLGLSFRGAETTAVALNYPRRAVIQDCRFHWNRSASDLHPSIDGGDPTVTNTGAPGDVRGWVRVARGRVDMGAFEHFTFEHGDLNCDGVIDYFDIGPLVAALLDPAFEGVSRGCGRHGGDLNLDGEVNFFDVDPFVRLLIDLP